MDVVEALLGEQHARYQIDSSGAKVFQAAHEGGLAPLQAHPRTLCGGFQHAHQRAAGTSVNSAHFRGALAKIDAQHIVCAGVSQDKKQGQQGKEVFHGGSWTTAVVQEFSCESASQPLAIRAWTAVMPASRLVRSAQRRVAWPTLRPVLKALP